MQKDVTFTNRLYVWQETYDFIQRSPILGYGMRDKEWFSENIKVKSAHNVIYQIEIYGGYILLSLFIFIIFVSVSRSIKLSSIHTWYTLPGVCAFFFMMIMEMYGLPLIFYSLCLLFYSHEFSKTEDA